MSWLLGAANNELHVQNFALSCDNDIDQKLLQLILMKTIHNEINVNQCRFLLWKASLSILPAGLKCNHWCVWFYAGDNMQSVFY